MHPLEIGLTPRLQSFASFATPLQGQQQRSGKASSALFLEGVFRRFVIGCLARLRIFRLRKPLLNQ